MVSRRNLNGSILFIPLEILAHFQWCLTALAQVCYFCFCIAISNRVSRPSAATSSRTHNARGQWSPLPSVPASPSELGRRRAPFTTWTPSGCRSTPCRCRLLVCGWGRAEIASPYPILQILIRFKFHLNFDKNFFLQGYSILAKIGRFG